MALKKTQSDTEPVVQLLHFESYPKGYGAQAQAGGGLCVTCQRKGKNFMGKKIIGNIAGILVCYVVYMVTRVVVIIGSSFIVGDKYANDISALANILGALLGIALFYKVYKHYTKTPETAVKNLKV